MPTLEQDHSSVWQRQRSVPEVVALQGEPCSRGVDGCGLYRVVDSREVNGAVRS